MMNQIHKMRGRTHVGASHSRVASGFPHTSYDLFIAAPMAGFKTREEFDLSRYRINSVIDRIIGGTGLQRIYYAGKTIGTSADFSPSDDALEQDLGALQRSKALLLIYPDKIATGALVELGYAMALKQPVAILVRSHEDLPYFLRHIQGRFTSSLCGPLVVLDYQNDAELPSRALDAVGLLGLL